MMVSSFGPVRGLVCIYLCDLKWPCTVGRDVARTLHGRPGNRLKAGVGIPSCWHPTATREEVSKKTWGPSSRTRSSLPTPTSYSVLPLLAVSYLQEGEQSPVVPNGPGPEKGADAAFQSVQWPLDSVCLSLTMASCVLRTAQQDVELGLLETELGPRAGKLRIGVKQKRTIDPPLRSRYSELSAKSVPPTMGTGSLFTTSCLA